VLDATEGLRGTHTVTMTAGDASATSGEVSLPTFGDVLAGIAGHLAGQVRAQLVANGADPADDLPTVIVEVYPSGHTAAVLEEAAAGKKSGRRKKADDGKAEQSGGGDETTGADAG
jgi:hypothetical protein